MTSFACHDFRRRSRKLALLLALLTAALPTRLLAQTGHQAAPAFGPNDYKLLPSARPAPRVPMTPAERDAAGGGPHGVFSVYEANCDVAAVPGALGEGLLPADAIVRPATQFFEARTAAKELDSITFELGQLVGRLKQNGDRVVPLHHLCVGIFPMPTPNAFAHSAGYIMIDPGLIRQLSTIPLLSAHEKFVYYHEFGHSLQFWHPALRFDDATDRRNELAADCVAGGLIDSGKQDQTFFRLYSVQSFTELAEIFGDDNVLSRHHHGRPEERANAVLKGAGIVGDRLRITNGSPVGVTGEWLLQQCNRAIGG